MADEDSRDNSEPSPSEARPSPTQIPLLEDIVDTGEARKAASRRPSRRHNYALDLDPAPPRTKDLFAPAPADSTAGDSLRGPPPADFFDAGPLPSPDVPWSVVDDALPVEPVAGESPAERQERLRASASRVVDDLVREYSHEIVRRLRDELTTLLDELDVDKDGQDSK